MQIRMNKVAEENNYVLVIGNGEMFIEMTLPYDGEDQLAFLSGIQKDITEGKINEEPEESKEDRKEVETNGAEDSTASNTTEEKTS